MKKLCRAFGAGCIGAMVSSFAFWLFAQSGILHAANCGMRPRHNHYWPYMSIVLGGFYALLMLIDWGPKRPVQRGLLYSLFPSLIFLTFILPQYMHSGYFGVRQGYITPLFVLAIFAIWGIITASLLDDSG